MIVTHVTVIAVLVLLVISVASLANGLYAATPSQAGLHVMVITCVLNVPVYQEVMMMLSAPRE